MRRRWMRRRLKRKGAGVLLAACAIASAASHAESITGVCPDGSVYIVQSAAAIPCSESKRVEPSDVPPVRPEYLPSPYTWQVYNERQNPNNPYNLIEAAREVRELGNVGEAGAGFVGAPQGAQERSAPTPPVVAESHEALQPLALGLSGDELRDLYEIVELSQRARPAELTRETADGRGVFAVRFAHSPTFERRLRDEWDSRGGLDAGGVLLFSAYSRRPEVFHPNFTLVQAHYTFQPDERNTAQFGLLAGRLGELDADEPVLGFVVLPPTMRLDSELDIYWDDRRITARF